MTRNKNFRSRTVFAKRAKQEETRPEIHTSIPFHTIFRGKTLLLPRKNILSSTTKHCFLLDETLPFSRQNRALSFLKGSFVEFKGLSQCFQLPVWWFRKAVSRVD